MARHSEAAPGTSADSAISISMLTQTARTVLEGAFSLIWVRGRSTISRPIGTATGTSRCAIDRHSPVRRVVARPGGHSHEPRRRHAGFGARTTHVYPLAARCSSRSSSSRRWETACGARRSSARARARGRRTPRDRTQAVDPRYPRCIAVITSPTGAALHDIAAVVKRRAPGVEIVVIPAAVQGETAPWELVEALDRLSRWRHADLVIVGRGGGSREDLWAFNDERVARPSRRAPFPRSRR